MNSLIWVRNAGFNRNRQLLEFTMSGGEISELYAILPYTQHENLRRHNWKSFVERLNPEPPISRLNGRVHRESAIAWGCDPNGLVELALKSSGFSELVEQGADYIITRASDNEYINGELTRVKHLRHYPIRQLSLTTHEWASAIMDECLKQLDIAKTKMQTPRGKCMMECYDWNCAEDFLNPNTREYLQKLPQLLIGGK